MIKNLWNRKDNRDDSFCNDNNVPSFNIDKKGKIIDINNAFCQELGCNKEEVLGLFLKDIDFITEQSRKKIRWRQILKLFGTVNPNFKINMRTHEGKNQILEINSKPNIKNGKNIGEICLVNNISEFTESQKENLTRKELKRTIKELENVCSDLDIKLRELSKFQTKLEKKCEEVETMNDDLEIRNRIIEEIKGQLMQNQSLLVEKTDTITHLENGLNELREELKLKNDELNTSRVVIEGTNKELLAAKHEIENNLDEIQALNNDIQIKNTIIGDIKGQLANRQTELVEKISNNNKLQIDLDQMQNELLVKEEELKTIQFEMENKHNELDSLTASLKVRDAIIEKMKEQLTDRQIDIVEKTDSFDRLQSELDQRRLEIEEKNTLINQLETDRKLGDITEKSVKTVTTKMDLDEQDTEKEVILHPEPPQEFIDDSVKLGKKIPIVGELTVEKDNEVNDPEFVENSEKQHPTWMNQLELHEEIDKILDLKTKKIDNED